MTAGNMLAALNKQGFVALYINFGTNKATIKPEEVKANNRCVEIVKNRFFMETQKMGRRGAENVSKTGF
jgi:hypothetical protein